MHCPTPARILIVLFISLYSFNSIAQKGRLKVVLPEDTYPFTLVPFDLIYFDLSIYKGDSLFDMKNDIYHLDTTIEKGIYTLEIYYDNRIRQHIYEVEVFADSVTIVAISATAHDSPYIPDSTSRYTTKGSMGVSFGYSSPLIGNGNSPVRQVWGIRQTNSFTMTFSRFFSAGMDVGGGLEYGHIPQYQTLSPPGPNKLERYTYWSIYEGLFLRTSFYDQRVDSAKGIDIDFGGYYNFPVFFRHVYLNGKTKTTNRFIHKFTDTRAFTRLGYNSDYLRFSVQVEYQLFDYVIAPFPELPKWSIRLFIQGTEYY